MGAPALVTILRSDTTVETYSSRSGGYSFGSTLVAYGVECFAKNALKSGWQKEAEQDLQSTWNYIGWAESFLILDYPNKTVLWNEHQLGLEPPRLISHLINESSPGWRSVWCPYGNDALWRYLKSDPTVFRREANARKRNWIISKNHFAPFSDPEESFGEDTLFTALLYGGDTACWLSDKSVEQVTESRIEDIEKIAKTMTGNTFERYPLWPIKDEYDESWPAGGVHLDFVQRKAWRWSNDSLEWDHFIPELWPGWSFIEIGDYYEIQQPFVYGRKIQHPHNQNSYFFEEPSYLNAQIPSKILARQKILALLNSSVEVNPAAFLQLDGTICWNPAELAR